MGRSSSLLSSLAILLFATNVRAHFGVGFDGDELYLSANQDNTITLDCANIRAGTWRLAPELTDCTESNFHVNFRVKYGPRCRGYFRFYVNIRRLHLDHNEEIRMYDSMYSRRFARTYIGRHSPDWTSESNAESVSQFFTSRDSLRLEYSRIGRCDTAPTDLVLDFTLVQTDKKRTFDEYFCPALRGYVPRILYCANDTRITCPDDLHWSSDVRNPGFNRKIIERCKDQWLPADLPEFIDQWIPHGVPNFPDHQNNHEHNQEDDHIKPKPKPPSHHDHEHNQEDDHDHQQDQQDQQPQQDHQRQQDQQDQQGWQWPNQEDQHGRRPDHGQQPQQHNRHNGHWVPQSWSPSSWIPEGIPWFRPGHARPFNNQEDRYKQFIPIDLDQSEFHKRVVGFGGPYDSETDLPDPIVFEDFPDTKDIPDTTDLPDTKDLTESTDLPDITESTDAPDTTDLPDTVVELDIEDGPSQAPWRSPPRRLSQVKHNQPSDRHHHYYYRMSALEIILITLAVVVMLVLLPIGMTMWCGRRGQKIEYHRLHTSPMSSAPPGGYGTFDPNYGGNFNGPTYSAAPLHMVAPSYPNAPNDVKYRPPQ